MFYTRLPTEEEAAAAGFTVADYEESIEVWPENWQAFQIFGQMGTQWRVGFNGPTGLDYQTLFEILDRYSLDGDEWWQMFDDIRLCESKALDTIQKNAR